MPTPIYVRINAAPELFGASLRTFYRWANDGSIRIYKRGGCSFVKVTEVMAWIEEGTSTEVA
ncbi:helix-turn-helix domain-containing protein [Pseudoroseicyclus aestuarii]|uniref:Excisionase family DNA binding protein n=1 Tax=Pseudoroseicyclus aestuarii TaxID=1795041 RepID=A0A318SS16_9RHOB|nr:helix-turn-helix domain-containing protein [Pseudoroseicyclus aestuarii]PYE80919.1 excisionase family DNA binding protein [Pseudoroseicyclus aestuarii]